MTMATRSAEDIRNDVKEQLTWDTRVDSSKIEVDVVDGTVILSGLYRPTLIAARRRRTRCRFPESPA
jgi:hyperosmotically inducible protein